MGAKELAKMKKRAILINTARWWMKLLSQKP